MLTEENEIGLYRLASSIRKNVNISTFLYHVRIKIQKHYFEIPESAIKVKCALGMRRNNINFQSNIQH